MHADLRRLLGYLVLLYLWKLTRHRLMRPRAALSGGVVWSYGRRRVERRCYRSLDLHRGEWLHESRGRRALAGVVLKARACQWTRAQSFLGNEIAGACQQPHFHHLSPTQSCCNYLSPVFRGLFYFLLPSSVVLRDVRHFVSSCIVSLVVFEPVVSRAARPGLFNDTQPPHSGRKFLLQHLTTFRMLVKTWLPASPL